MDIMSEQRDCTEEELLAIQSSKTGALINAACVLGVIAAGGSEAQLAAAGRFAGALGLAFQIRDDMLDVIGTTEEMGKGVGTDATKNTFVKIYGLEECERLVQKYTDAALEALNEFKDSTFMATLAKNLVARRV
jgi:geranylgeranyl diphosphate synthase type II